MNPIHFYLQAQLRNFKATCQLHNRQIAAAKTMRQVQMLSHVAGRPECRMLSEYRSAQQTVDTSAEKRLDALLAEQLAALASCASAGDARAMRGRWMMNEWVHLRGKFAKLYRKAEHESRRIVYALEQAEKNQAVAQ